METDETVSPFLYFDFMKYVWWQTKLFTKYRPIVYYAVNDGGDVIMIAPMKLDVCSGKIDTLGNKSMCNITDFLYQKGLTKDHMDLCRGTEKYKSDLGGKYLMVFVKIQ